VQKIRKEFEALRTSGFDVEYWEPADIAARFPFRKPGAIALHGDAEVNPFRFVNALAEAASDMGLAIYEETDVVAHETLEGGRHRLRTSAGATIEADFVVYAVGYEPEELRGRFIKAELNRTFVVVTEPVSDRELWHERCLLWETTRPYFYMRTTPDGRIIAGGLDEDEQRPVTDERDLRKRSDRLQELVGSLIPSCQAPIAYEWSATFGESQDNLPFIGEDPAWTGVYYCLCYGGNGTIHSMIASRLLRCLIRGEDHPVADIVRLDRPSLQTGAATPPQ